MDLVTILLAAHRSAQRRHLRDRTTFWTTLLVLTLGPLLLACSMLLRTACACTPRRMHAWQESQYLARAIELFGATHGRCPSGMAELRARNFLAREQNDPWGRPYVITCDADRDLLRVCSRGHGGLARSVTMMQIGRRAHRCDRGPPTDHPSPARPRRARH